MAIRDPKDRSRRPNEPGVTTPSPSGRVRDVTGASEARIIGPGSAVEDPARDDAPAPEGGPHGRRGA